MQQENNYTDNLLRKLENDSLPDLSQLNTHWKSMQQLLIPQPQPVNGTGKFFKNPFRLLVVTAVTVTSVFLLYKSLPHKELDANLPVIETNKDATPQQSVKVAQDTIVPVVKVNKLVKDTLPGTKTITHFKTATPSVAIQNRKTAPVQLTARKNVVQKPMLRVKASRPDSASASEPIKPVPVKRRARIAQAEKTLPVIAIDTIVATKKTEPLKYDFELVVRDSSQFKKDTIKIIKDRIE